MKFTRVIALMIVGIMLVLSLASCGEVVPEIKVTLKIVADDPDNPILNTEVKLQTKDPTVLDAFIEGCTINEIPFKLTSDNTAVQDIKDYKDYTDADNIAHYWMYLINDVEPTSGKANANSIKDGDVILYQYLSFDPSTVTGKAN
jgi:hypothetical protein